jgi:hypothetical protein
MYFFYATTLETLSRSPISWRFFCRCCANGRTVAHTHRPHRKHVSGAFANGGEAVFRNLVWALERVNERGGVALPGGARRLVLERYDSKGQIEEALSLLRAAIDDGAQFILQGNSSAVTAALIDAVNKHNEREPQPQAWCC